MAIFNEMPSKDALSLRLDSIQQALEVKPLSYVDSNKFYTCIDAAYLIYDQLVREEKFSKKYAWCIANCALYGWFFKSLVGSTLSADDVEREVYKARSKPTEYIIKNIIIGTIQMFMTITPSLLSVTNVYIGNLTTIFFYVVLTAINIIKLTYSISKREINPLEAIKPIS